MTNSSFHACRSTSLVGWALPTVLTADCRLSPLYLNRTGPYLTVSDGLQIVDQPTTSVIPRYAEGSRDPEPFPSSRDPSEYLGMTVRLDFLTPSKMRACNVHTGVVRSR